MRKIAALGAFYIGRQHTDGQTIKTNLITDWLAGKVGEDQVWRIDTYRRRTLLLFLPFLLIRALWNYRCFVFFLERRGFFLITPLLDRINFFFRRPVHYIAVGGWLPDFLKERPRYLPIVRRFAAVYVQATLMKEMLEAQGLTNVVLLPNSRNFTPFHESDLVYFEKEPFPLCTFSRVAIEKGIGDAVEAVTRYNEEAGRTVFTLDIYGAVNPLQIGWFEELQKGFPPSIRYRGIAPFERSREVVKNYYALLFPSFIDREGMPGTIVDAFSAGVPVIATDLRYNKEWIFENRTGLLFRKKDREDLLEKLRFIHQNQDLWNGMKRGILQEAEKYRMENVMKILWERLEL